MGITTVNRVINYGRRVFDTEHLMVAPIKEEVRKSPCTVIAPAQAFPRALPEETGLRSADILAFLTALKNDRSLNMHTIFMVKDKKVVCEASFGAYDIHLPSYTFSACKSVTSLAIGLLFDEGKLSLDENLAEVFPDEVNPVSKLRYKEITVKDLLTMRSTVLFNEAASMTEENWAKGFFTSLAKGDIGKTFNYNSLNTYMLSCIVCKKSGVGLTEYLTPRLFKPLGIENVYWEKSPDGIEKGGWGLYICPEDFAKLGQLLLDNGIWNGRRILSEEYCKLATMAHAIAPNDYGDYNYGYQIWVGRKRDSFLFNGMFGQNVLCMRKSGIIIVSTAGNGELFQQSTYFAYADRYFGDPNPATTPDLIGNRNLKNYIASLALPEKARPGFLSGAVQKHRTAAACETLNGVCLSAKAPSPQGFMPLTLQILSGRFCTGFTGVDFTYEKGVLFLTMREKDDTYRFSVGFGKYEVQDITCGINTYRIAVTGRFAENDDGLEVLRLRVDFLETPCSKIIRFVFDGDDVTLSSEELPGAKFVDDNVTSILNSLEEKPVIAAIIGKLDADYLTYRIKKKLSPALPLFCATPALLQKRDLLK